MLYHSEKKKRLPGTKKKLGFLGTFPAGTYKQSVPWGFVLFAKRMVIEARTQGEVH